MLNSISKAKNLSLYCFVLTVVVISAGTALAQNNPPVAYAGPDQTIFIGDATVLQGSATDPDGDPITGYRWFITSQPIGSVPIFGPVTSPTPDFVPDMLGDYFFAFQAMSTDGISLPDYVTIHVVTNQPPVAVAASDVNSGPAPLTVSFDGTGSFDPEGGALFFTWTFGDGSTPSLDSSPTHVYQFPGTYVADVTVVDDRGQSDRDTILITVSAAALIVDIDVKPRRFPNYIELERDDEDDDCDDDSRLKVAILTTADFDALTVIAPTVELGDPNLPGKVTPIRNKAKDVDRDKDKDLLLVFDICDMVRKGALDPNSTELVLTGKTLGGTSITGSDSVYIDLDDDDEEDEEDD